MTVPTTFILDRDNTPRVCNNGVATRDKLMRQLSDLGLTGPLLSSAA